MVTVRGYAGSTLTSQGRTSATPNSKSSQRKPEHSLGFVFSSQLLAPGSDFSLGSVYAGKGLTTSSPSRRSHGYSQATSWWRWSCCGFVQAKQHDDRGLAAGRRCRLRACEPVWASSSTSLPEIDFFFNLANQWRGVGKGVKFPRKCQKVSFSLARNAEGIFLLFNT